MLRYCDEVQYKWYWTVATVIQKLSFFFQIVAPSRASPFTLSAIAIPGGTLLDGAMELEEGKKFCRVSYIVLSLGTNDVLRARSNFAHKFQNDLATLISTAQKNYPQAKVSFFF